MKIASPIAFSLAVETMLLTSASLFAADTDDHMGSAVKKSFVTELVADISGVKSVVNNMTVGAVVPKN